MSVCCRRWVAVVHHDRVESKHSCIPLPALQCSWPAKPSTALCPSLPGLPVPCPICRAARFDFVSLANNHSLDYKEAGLLETQQVLRSAGIAFAGVGRAAEAAAPVLLERAGLKIAFLSYSGRVRCGGMETTGVARDMR